MGHLIDLSRQHGGARYVVHTGDPVEVQIVCRIHLERRL
jgi:hypothetical protein